MDPDNEGFAAAASVLDDQARLVADEPVLRDQLLSVAAWLDRNMARPRQFIDLPLEVSRQAPVELDLDRHARPRTLGPTGKPFYWSGARSDLGIEITIGREDVTGQLFVTIVTEKLPPVDVAPDGEPYLAVSLNDSELFDRNRPGVTG